MSTFLGEAHYPVLDAEDASPRRDPPAALVRGRDPALTSFLRELNPTIATIAQCGLIELGYRATSVDADTWTLRELKPGVTSICTLAPAPADARALKRRVRAQLSRALADATLEELLYYSNEDLEVLGDDDGHLAREFSAALRVALPAASLDVTRDALQRWLANSSEAWWREAFGHAVDASIFPATRAAAELVWSLWQAWSSAIRTVAARVLDERIVPALVAAAPEVLVSEVSEPVLAVAYERRWAALHGVVALASMDAGAALRLQTDRFAEDQRSIATLCSRVEPRALIGVALALDHGTVTSIAGRAIASEPALLDGFTPDVGSWRELLLAALTKGLSFDCRHLDISALIGALTAADARRRECDERLLERLARAGRLDLLEHPRRVAIWAELPVGTRTAALATTAASWIRTRLGSGAHGFFERVEPPLGGAIADGLKKVGIPALSVTALRDLIRMLPSLDQAWYASALKRAPLGGAPEAVLRDLASDCLRHRNEAAANAVFRRWRQDHDPAWLAFLEPAEALLKLGARLELWFAHRGSTRRRPTRDTSVTEGRRSWALVTFLVRGFSSKEMYRLATELELDAVVRESDTSRVELAEDLVAAASRRGKLPDFFALLLQERPRHSADIEDLARRYGI